MKWNAYELFINLDKKNEKSKALQIVFALLWLYNASICDISDVKKNLQSETTHDTLKFAIEPLLHNDILSMN